MTISTVSKHKLSIIVPTYSEAPNIIPLINGIVKSLNERNLNEYEIIVIDDDSPDDTKEVCRKLADKCPTLKLITRVGERGLATAIYRGIAEASGDVVITMDADLSHDPNAIPRLVDNILNNSADIVVASRFVDGAQMHSSFEQTLGSKVLNIFISVLLQLHIKDVTGGFLAIRKDSLKDVDKDSIFWGYGDYSFALLYEGRKQGLKIDEIAFNYYPRKNGSSKTKLLYVGVSYGIRALKLRFSRS